MRSILTKILQFSIFLIAFLSVQRYSPAPIVGTVEYWAIEFMILIVFGLSIFYFGRKNNNKFLFVVTIYIGWITFSIIRGILTAENYWDWKGLIENAFLLLIPIATYSFANKEILQDILSFYFRFALPLSIIIVFPMYPSGAWGWYLFPVSFVMLFFPLLKTNWKVILLVISLAAMLGDITVRSHVFKYGIPIIFLLLYYFRFFVSPGRIIKASRRILLVAPWILFFLAVSGVFNIFRMDEYAKNIKHQSSGEQALTTDSRTFLYEEVLSSAIKYNYWRIGRTPARGNETTFFAEETYENTGRNERLRNEANILNIFTWTGIVGVILLFIVFGVASWLAIYRSNNIFSQLIGLFVAFRWAYGWVEDYFIFDLNTFVIWMMIGVCFSKGFRSMNNLEVKLWVRGIFEKKYKSLYRNIIDKELSNVNVNVKKIQIW